MCECVYVCMCLCVCVCVWCVCGVCVYVYVNVCVFNFNSIIIDELYITELYILYIMKYISWMDITGNTII